VNEENEVRGLSGQIRDNYLCPTVEANDSSSAIEQANEAVDAFLQHLAVSMRSPTRPGFFPGSGGRPGPSPRPLTFGYPR
jgi:hypothetical protein